MPVAIRVVDRLQDLADVNVGLVDGQFLLWDDTTEKFIQPSELSRANGVIQVISTGTEGALSVDYGGSNRTAIRVTGGDVDLAGGATCVSTQGSIHIHGLGTMDDTDREELHFEWDSTDQTYRISTEQSGTGVLRPLQIQTTGLTVLGHTASHIPLVVKAAVSQTANLLEIQDSDGTAVSGFDADGIPFGSALTTPGGSNTHVQFNNNGAFGGSASLTWSGTALTIPNIEGRGYLFSVSDGMFFRTGGGARVTIESGAEVRIVTNGTDRFCVDGSGLTGINKSSSIGAQLHVVSSTSTTIGQIVQGATNHSAALLQLNMTGTPTGSVFEINDPSSNVVLSAFRTGDGLRLNLSDASSNGGLRILNSGVSTTVRARFAGDGASLDKDGVLRWSDDNNLNNPDTLRLTRSSGGQLAVTSTVLGVVATFSNGSYGMIGSSVGQSFYLNTGLFSAAWIDTSANFNIYDGRNLIGPTSSALDWKGPAVFNETGGDFDFRIEGDTDTNLFFSDASVDRIGIGIGSSLGGKLHVLSGSSTTIAGLFEGTTSHSVPVLQVKCGGGSPTGNVFTITDSSSTAYFSVATPTSDNLVTIRSEAATNETLLKISGAVANDGNVFYPLDFHDITSGGNQVLTRFEQQRNAASGRLTVYASNTSGTLNAVMQLDGNTTSAGFPSIASLTRLHASRNFNTNDGETNYGAQLHNTADGGGVRVALFSASYASSGSATRTAGYFTLGNPSSPPTFANGALFCDNGSTTSDIFVARDNGTACLKIANGGTTTITATSTAQTLLRLESNTGGYGIEFATTAGLIPEINFVGSFNTPRIATSGNVAIEIGIGVNTVAKFGTGESRSLLLTPPVSTANGLVVNGYTNHSVALLQLNMTGSPTNNVLEINLPGGSGGDAFKVEVDGNASVKDLVVRGSGGFSYISSPVNNHIQLWPGNVSGSAWHFDKTGFIRPVNTNDAQDLGTSSAMLRSGYFGTSVVLGSADLYLMRAAAANLRLGSTAANPPVAQTLSVQNASGTDIAGANFTIAGSQGTGTGAGGSIIFKTAPAGTTGSSLNALTDAMTIDSAGLVGIGQTTPTHGLTIGGTTNFQGSEFQILRGSNRFSVSLSVNEGGMIYIGSPVSSPVSFHTNNVERLTVANTTGYVGINKISSIGGQLHVVSSGSTTPGIIVDGATSHSVPLLRLNQTGTPTGNVFEINAPGTSSGGDILKVSVAGKVTIPGATGFQTFNSLFSNYGNTVWIGLASSPSATDGIVVHAGGHLQLLNSVSLVWAADHNAAGNLILMRAGAANLRLGETAANPPVAQTLSVQNASGTNTAGVNWTFDASAATGNAAGGGFAWRTSDAGGSGSTLQSYTTKMTLTGAGWLAVNTSTSPIGPFDVRAGSDERIVFTSSGPAGGPTIEFVNDAYTLNVVANYRASSHIFLNGVMVNTGTQLVTGNTGLGVASGAGVSVGATYCTVSSPVSGAIIEGSVGIGLSSSLGGKLHVVSSGSTTIAGLFEGATSHSVPVLVVKGGATPTGNLQEWQTSAGLRQFAVNPSGWPRFYDSTGNTIIGDISTDSGTGATVYQPTNVVYKGFVVRAQSGHLSNLFEAQNSSGTAYVSVGPPTLAGDSATKNFFNVTGTLPSTLTASTIAVHYDITPAGSSSQVIWACNIVLNAGYTGSSGTAALRTINATAGTANGSFLNGTSNNGYNGGASGTTIGKNIGVLADARNGDINYGVVGLAGIAKNAATNVGCAGFGLNTGTTPIHLGGFFALLDGSANPTLASAALMCDNGSTTSDIFVARNNGTAFFTIADSDTVFIDNSSSSASAASTISFRNSVLGGTDVFSVGLTGVNYTSVSAWQDSAILFARQSISGGLNIDVETGGGDIKFGMFNAGTITTYMTIANGGVTTFTQAGATVIPLKVTGATNHSVALLQLNMTGTPTNNVLEINLPSGSGGDALKVTSNGSVVLTGAQGLLSTNANSEIGAPFLRISRAISAGVAWGYISASADGVLSLKNAALNNFGRLCFGGETSAEPAIKRSSATLAFRLADDSDYCDISARVSLLSRGIMFGTSGNPGLGTIQGEATDTHIFLLPGSAASVYIKGHDATSARPLIFCDSSNNTIHQFTSTDAGGLALTWDSAVTNGLTITGPAATSLPLKITGATNHSVALLQLNMTGTPTNNVFEINLPGGSGGDAFRVSATGQLIAPVTSVVHTIGYFSLNTDIISSTGAAKLRSVNSSEQVHLQQGATDRLVITTGGLIGIGGVSASYPAIKPNSTVMEFKLADDSAYCNTTAKNVVTGAEANGQNLGVKVLTELLTIAAAATSTTTIQKPANSIILAVSVRVTTAVTCTSTFNVGDSGSANRFNTAAVSKAVNSTDPGTKAGAYYNATAEGIVITPDTTPTDDTGRVRVTIHYLECQPPTS